MRSFCVGALSCVAVLLACLPAHGGAPAVFVDSALVCAGRSPCFATIQEGVRNASPGTAVNVFPSDYEESVDIGLMGDAIGGALGALTLRTVNGAGNPTPGTASILPMSGPAIFSSVSPFTGDLTVEGFTIQSPDDDGIFFDLIQGTVTLSHLISDGNDENGFLADFSGDSDMNATDSSFSNNKDGNGLIFSGAADVTFERVTANANSGNGALFDVTGNVRVYESTFNDNKGDGLIFSTDLDVDFERVTANANGRNGALFDVKGSVRVHESVFNDNKDQDGLIFSCMGDVTFEEVTALRNADNGALFDMDGNLDVAQSNFNDNKTGDGLIFSGAVDINFERVNADRNGDNGALFDMEGNLYVGHSSFSDNKTGIGLLFSVAVDVTLDHVVVDRNGEAGALFGVDGDVRITDSSFSNNVLRDGLVFDNAVRLVAARIVASGNGRHGLEATMTHATILASRFEENGQDGVQLSPRNPPGEFVLRCNDIAGNARGLVVNTPATVLAESNYWNSPTGPTHPSNPAGTGDSIVDGANGGAGTVDFVPFLTKPAAESGQCATRPAPVLDTTAFAMLLLALFIFPARRLARARAARSS